MFLVKVNYETHEFGRMNIPHFSIVIINYYASFKFLRVLYLNHRSIEVLVASEQAISAIMF